MAEHLDDDALEGHFIPGEDSQKDKTHVADARVGDEAFEVALGKGQNGPVEDADDAQRHGKRGEFRGCAGKEGDGKPQEAVPAGFQEQAGEDDAPRCGGLGVRIGKPGVERDGRELDKKGREKAQQKENGRPGVQGRSQKLEIVEGIDSRLPPVDEIEPQDGGQHQQAGELGEDEKFHGGINASLVPPQGDEKIHGDEHELPEEVKEKEIDGNKDADDPRQGRHEVEMEETRPALRSPSRKK